MSVTEYDIFPGRESPFSSSVGSNTATESARRFRIVEWRFVCVTEFDARDLLPLLR